MAKTIKTIDLIVQSDTWVKYSPSPLPCLGFIFHTRTGPCDPAVSRHGLLGVVGKRVHNTHSLLLLLLLLLLQDAVMSTVLCSKVVNTYSFMQTCHCVNSFSLIPGQTGRHKYSKTCVKCHSGIKTCKHLCHSSMCNYLGVFTCVHVCLSGVSSLYCTDQMIWVTVTEIQNEMNKTNSVKQWQSIKWMLLPCLSTFLI